MEHKLVLLEDVCGKCPATKWGESTSCSTFGCHIAAVGSCPMWDKYLAESKEGLIRKDDQCLFADLEPAYEALQVAEETIRSYTWLLVKVAEMENLMDDAGEGVVGNYGDPNAGIRAQYKNSDKTLAEVARRSREWARLERMRFKISVVESFVSSLTSERERLLLEDLMDGKKVKDAAANIGVSNTRAHEIKARLIRQLAWSLSQTGGRVA